MQKANCRLLTNDLGSCIPKNDITPAEAMLLGASYVRYTGGKYPLFELVSTGEAMDVTLDAQRQPVVDETGKAKLVPRTTVSEIRRLRGIYGKKAVDDAFPGKMPKLPESFKEAEEAVMADVADAGSNTQAEPATLFGAASEVDRLIPKNAGKPAASDQ